VRIDALFERTAVAPPAAAGEMPRDDDPMIPGHDGVELPDEPPEAGGIGDDLEQERANPPGQLIVDDVVLDDSCTLKVIRAAARKLGVGQSGGKATVLKRIAEALKLQEIAEHANSPSAPLEPQGQTFVEHPTEAEKQRHMLTHVPFASWCSHCTKYRARSDRHEHKRAEDREHSVLAFDFYFTSRENDPASKLVCLAMRDSHTQYVQALPVPSKGGTVAFKYMVAEICRTLNYLGHETVTLRSDGEPACLALQRGVQAFRAKMKLKTVLEQTEAGDSQANPAEPAIEQVRQLAGTLISAYEDGAQVQVSSLHPMHSWAHRHASWLLQRYSQTHGHSCFELLTGRPYAGKIVPFGETVFGRLRSAVKGKPRWTRMIWLGKLQVSDLHFGVSETGHMLSTRSVRRVPDRFDKSMHEKVLDQPWSQAAFLSGQMGQARAQKTLADAPAPAEEAPVPLPFCRRRQPGILNHQHPCAMTAAP